MTGLITLRSAIVAGLKDVPGLLSSESAEGTIGNAELKRISIRAPGALTAIMGIEKLTKSGAESYRAEVNVGVFLVLAGNGRLTDAVNMIEQITLRVADSTWGVPYTALPTEIKVETLYDDGDQSRGLLLMGITWRQETRIARAAPYSTASRADDNSEAEALGHNEGDWPDTITGVIDP